MTDPTPLTPEQEGVRRLLADARHDGPTPPDVVARLDERLAALVAERADAPTHGAAERVPTPAPVVDLAARRRRRAGIGLLAAAAVVVAGVALGQTIPRGSGSDSGSSSAADSDGSSTSGSQDDSAGGAVEEMAPETRKGLSPAPLSDSPTLSTTDAALGDVLVDLRDSDRTSAPGLGVVESQRACDLSGIGRGRRVVAQVDGTLGVVVFRRPDGATQQADLYACGLSLPVRTVTLPAP